MERLCYSIHLLFTDIIYHLFNYLFILLRHYFRLVNPFFCHVLVCGGDPILTIIMYIYFVHLSFLGDLFVHMYIVLFDFLNCSPPPHTVNMGLSLEVHGALVLFW